MEMEIGIFSASLGELQQELGGMQCSQCDRSVLGLAVWFGGREMLCPKLSPPQLRWVAHIPF